ncbi:hypothetical protein BT69DRAFT_805654 [Atractiella rhizophila]|nr:hypothetical protein BT69DRAFT_805654 [Atractiella rhizophila]
MNAVPLLQSRSEPWLSPSTPGITAGDKEESGKDESGKDESGKDEYPTYEEGDPKVSETYSVMTLVEAFLPSLLGIAYVIFCVYVSDASSPPVISHSTAHATELRGATTAIANIWIFISLLFVGNLIDRIRSEEWHRRLMSATEVGTPFAHLNHVSSNLGGTLRHAVDLFSFFTGSSRPFKSVFISALLAIALNETAPSILQVVPGWYPIGRHNISIPSLPPLSLHANLSTVFSRTSTTSSELATVYVFAKLNNEPIFIYRNFPNAVVPLPNILSDHGEVYETDVGFFAYDCEWMAPVLGNPIGSTTAEVISNRMTYAGGGYMGFGSAPFWPDTLDLLDTIYKLSPDNTTLVPSYDGVLMITVQSAPLEAIQQSRGLWMDTSSIPTSPIPSTWSAFQTDAANLYGNPIATDVSMLLCIPQVIVESHRITVRGGTYLSYHIEPLDYRVGNIDETQLRIAMSDSLLDFATSTYFYLIPMGLSGGSAEETIGIYTPINQTVLGPTYTRFVQSALSAYLDGGPFGTMDVDSQGSRLGLVLKAQREFLWLVAGFYALLALVGAAVVWFTSGRREQRIGRFLGIGRVLSLVQWGGRDFPSGLERTLNGRRVAVVAAEVAGGEGKMESEEERALLAFRTARVCVKDFPSVDGVAPALSVQIGPPVVKGWLERKIKALRNVVMFITPVVGGAFVAFGVYAYKHDVVVPIKIEEERLVLIGTLFTIAVGFWRTLALGGTRSAIREVRSEEWTRLSDLAQKNGQTSQPTKHRSSTGSATLSSTHRARLSQATIASLSSLSS